MLVDQTSRRGRNENIHPVICRISRISYLTKSGILVNSDGYQYLHRNHNVVHLIFLTTCFF
ncbi:MAG TPA: hypothetical protein DDW43_11550 [Nitrosomonas sp.]|nr:hypothetical protein [Nitrosomonas sp. PRO5]HBF26094.1 hypothetical protein [Nitrosomonas sp.]